MRQIRLRERQAEQAQLALDESIAEFRRALRARLSSRTAMAAGFAGGLLLGWRRSPRRAAAGAEPVRAQARHGLPRHWLRIYFVWPFLLATARDLLVARRPSRREV